VSDIINSSKTYNGRLIKNYYKSAIIRYTTKNIVSKVLTKDIGTYVSNIRQNESLLPLSSCDPIYNPTDENGNIIQYNGLRNTTDNTIPEIDIKDTYENFARLSPGNLGKNTPWQVGHKALNPIDFGHWNDADMRIESYFRPKTQDDLKLLGSTIPPSRYENDNLEVGIRRQDIDVNNAHYVAWENRTEIRKDLICGREKYNVLNFISGVIGRGIKIGDPNGKFIIGSGYDSDTVHNYQPSSYYKNNRYVDAEVYKAVWNFGDLKFTKENDEQP